MPLVDQRVLASGWRETNQIKVINSFRFSCASPQSASQAKFVLPNGWAVRFKVANCENSLCIWPACLWRPNTGRGVRACQFPAGTCGVGAQDRTVQFIRPAELSRFRRPERAADRACSEFQPDVIFCVLMHYEVWFETLDLDPEKSPAMIVNWGTDNSWKFRQFSRFLCDHVDLHVTTDSGALSMPRRAWGSRTCSARNGLRHRRSLAEPLPRPRVPTT